MAQRTWFTMANTTIPSSLTATDLQILNRAVRRLFDVTSPPSSQDLATIRMLYRSGMSAADLIDSYDRLDANPTIC